VLRSAAETLVLRSSAGLRHAAVARDTQEKSGLLTRAAQQKAFTKGGITYPGRSTVRCCSGTATGHDPAGSGAARTGGRSRHTGWYCGSTQHSGQGRCKGVGAGYVSKEVCKEGVQGGCIVTHLL